MSTNNREAIERDVREMFGLVPDWVRQIPDAALEGFWKLEKDFYLADTQIPVKYKELIGIAVSGATRCKYCTLFHTEGARLQGATDAEIAEASMMAGVTMMASTFLNAQQVDYDDFKRETEAVVAHVRAQLERPPEASRPEAKYRETALHA